MDDILAAINRERYLKNIVNKSHVFKANKDMNSRPNMQENILCNPGVSCTVYIVMIKVVIYPSIYHP